VANDWGGLDGLPTSFFIDRDGKIVDQTIGLYSRDAVEAKIKKILASAPSQATPKGD
jgi:cytochrome c biogenesis protein CcmG/thiol:disulfide interchange protein DsbE